MVNNYRTDETNERHDEEHTGNLIRSNAGGDGPELRQDVIDRLREFAHLRGERYARCTFANFEATTEKQQAALAAVQAYAANMKERVKAGQNLILFGTRGCGKDHLLAALMRQSVVMGLKPGGLFVSIAFYRDILQWITGADLFAEFRSMFDKKGGTEANMIREYTQARVLAISDPVSEKVGLTDYQRECLYRIIDTRYSHMMPTWITVNATNAADLDERVGKLVSDRLRDGALCVPMLWESHRKSATS